MENKIFTNANINYLMQFTISHLNKALIIEFFFWELPDFCSIFQVALFELCPLKWTHPWSLLRPRTRHQCFPRNPQPSFAHVSRSQTFVCKHKSGNFQHHHTIEHNVNYVVHVYKNNTQPINWEECPTFCNAYLKKGLFIF